MLHGHRGRDFQGVAEDAAGRTEGVEHSFRGLVEAAAPPDGQVLFAAGEVPQHKPGGNHNGSDGAERRAHQTPSGAPEMQLQAPDIIGW